MIWINVSNNSQTWIMPNSGYYLTIIWPLFDPCFDPFFWWLWWSLIHSLLIQVWSIVWSLIWSIIYKSKTEFRTFICNIWSLFNYNCKSLFDHLLDHLVEELFNSNNCLGSPVLTWKSWLPSQDLYLIICLSFKFDFLNHCFVEKNIWTLSFLKRFSAQQFQ